MGKIVVKCLTHREQLFVDYDELFQVIYCAHEENRKNGLKINTLITGADLLKEHLKQAVIIVAKDDQKIIGTISVKTTVGKQRFIKGHRVAYLMHLAILPEYWGQGIAKQLFNEAETYARKEKTDAIVFHVAERNPAKRIYEHLGYISIDFIPRISLKQNSVFMSKWINNYGIQKWKVLLFFKAKKIYVKIKYRFS